MSKSAALLVRAAGDDACLSHPGDRGPVKLTGKWTTKSHEGNMKDYSKSETEVSFFSCVIFLPATNCTEYSALLCVLGARLTFS